MSDAILIVGATGLIGRETALRLLAEGRRVRALTRDLERAGDLRAAGAEVVAGDLARPESLDRALEGVTAALLVSSQSPDQVELQGNFVAAAARAARRPQLVKISGFLTGLDSTSRSGRWHAETEAAVTATGLDWTFLRSPFFMQNLVRTRPHTIDSGELAMPMDRGRVAIVDARDIAAVAAVCLTDAGHRGQAYLVTGPEAITFAEVAERLSRFSGREVAYRRLTLEQMRERLEAAGTPAWRIHAVLEFYAGFEAGLGAEVTDVVQRVTGRPPHRLEDFLASADAAGLDA